MLEVILFFGLGYFVGLIHLTNIYKSHVDLKYADKVLSWNPDTLGWRPVLDRQNLQPGKKYLLAFEVCKNEDSEK